MNLHDSQQKTHLPFSTGLALWWSPGILKVTDSELFSTRAGKLETATRFCSGEKARTMAPFFPTSSHLLQIAPNNLAKKSVTIILTNLQVLVH